MRFYRKAARLQAPSHAIAHTIATEAPRLANRVAAIPYPLTRSRMINSPPPAIGDRDKIILFVGRVHPEKGVHLLIDAFASGARTIFADWKLVIVGPAEEKLGGGGKRYLLELKQRAERADGKVIFRGAIFDQIGLEENFRAAKI